jgi:hypothetical protein
VNRRDLLKAAAIVPVAASSRISLAKGRPSISAEVQLARLLEATGGRSNWISAFGYEVEAQHYLAVESKPFANRILLDFRTPRVRIDSAHGVGWRSRILDGDRGGRLASEGARALSSDEVADDRIFWATNVYRTLHRLAKQEADLAIEITSDARLMVFERTKPLLWYRQNFIGEPIAFGRGTDLEATIFGPLVRFGPLMFPSFSVRDGGRWRAIIERFTVDPDLTDATLLRGLQPSPESQRE